MQFKTLSLTASTTHFTSDKLVCPALPGCSAVAGAPDDVLHAHRKLCQCHVLHQQHERKMHETTPIFLNLTYNQESGLAADQMQAEWSNTVT